MINYGTEVQNLDSLASELNDLKEKLKQETSKLSSHPPLWNGEIQNLKNFTTELREWWDEPKLKEVKNIIREFRGICDDNRKFQFDENKSYYISILDILAKGKEILDAINNDIIKKEAARVILDQVFQQNEEEALEVEIKKIREFWDEFNKKIINFDTEDDIFIKEVKNECIEKSLKTGFNNDEIRNVYQEIEKANNSRKLLKEIDSNVFLSEYEKSEDINGIWNISDEIRRKLDSTNIDIAGVPEDTKRKIFNELLGYINSRDEALNEANLTKVKGKLDDLFEKLKSWGNKVKRFTDDDIKQLDSWLTAIKNSRSNSERIQDKTFKITDLRQKFNSLRFENFKDIRTKEVYGIFEEYYKLKKDIEDFFKDLLSEDARRVLDNLSNLDKIREEIGDNFWKATEELCNAFPQLKIKMEWRKV
jgi:hypothetical protein